MRIIEQFTSLQGEGILAGVPTSFIRTAGCNLRCRWCDTGYSFDPGQDLSIAEICNNVTKRHVCITGGEPLLQPDLRDLVYRLKDMNKVIEIETNGSIEPASWAFLSFSGSRIVDSWSVDIKLPSSGNPSGVSDIEDWLVLMDKRDQVKMVVSGDADIRMAFDWAERIRRLFTVRNILISPAAKEGEFDREFLQMVAAFCIDADLRMSIQMHKIIWGDKKGV